MKSEVVSKEDFEYWFNVDNDEKFQRGYASNLGWYQTFVDDMDVEMDKEDLFLQLFKGSP